MESRQTLTQYVTEARAAGAAPVLVTSIVRRNFTKDNKIKADCLVSETKGMAERQDDKPLDGSLHPLPPKARIANAAVSPPEMFRGPVIGS